MERTEGRRATRAPTSRPSTDAGAARAVRAVEDLRMAEAQLARRRQQDDRGPSQTTLDVLRLVVEAAERDELITPTDIARQTGLTGSGITPVLKRLVVDGLVSFTPSPQDARSKTVQPTERGGDQLAATLDARIVEAAADLDPASADAVARFLDRVRAIVDEECT
ncbi:MarR family winged helix-turn-helix transcriptional regulator [Agrococcus jejuensis]|nr:MarR family transcriptional regulator [Agrococcus jejuensis]